MSFLHRFLLTCWAVACLTGGATAAAADERNPAADWSQLDDAALIQTVAKVGTDGLLARLESGVAALPEYELWMRRQERLADGWNDKPFVHYIKYRHQPRQVYMAWMKGGPKAGQELIFDESRRKDAMYGHLSGLLNIMSMWTALDSPLARGNSAHSIRDVGLQSVVEILRAQHELRRQAGAKVEPDKIELMQVAGQRVVAVTWRAAPGLTQGYAAQTRLALDLQRPLIKQVESWDEQGQLKERVLFERVQPARFSLKDFDPTNPDYRF